MEGETVATLPPAEPFPAWHGPRSGIELMCRLKAGHADSLDLLIKRHRDGVFGCLYRRIRNAPAAGDLTQETFLRIYLASARYEAAAKFATWLYGIAANLARGWIRDHRRGRLTEPIGDLLYAPRWCRTRTGRWITR